MTLNEYQIHASATALGLAQGPFDLVYCAMGLAGESGELLEKVKKAWRNDGVTHGEELSVVRREQLLEELGDVLWYAAAIASALRVTLDTAARLNLEKLASRQVRGVLAGEGDRR